MLRRTRIKKAICKKCLIKKHERFGEKKNFNANEIYLEKQFFRDGFKKNPIVLTLQIIKEKYFDQGKEKLDLCSSFRFRLIDKKKSASYCYWLEYL